EVSYFSVADQRSLEAVEGGLDAPPCREILLTPQVRERARAMAEELPGVRDLLLRIADGTAAEGMESLSPVLVEEMEQVADVLPAGSRFLILDPEKVRARAEELVATTDEFLAAAWSSAAAGGGLPIDVGAASFVPLSEAKGHARAGGRPWVTLSGFGLDTDVDVTARSTTHPGYSGRPGDAAKDLEQRRKDGWSIIATMVGPGGARHATENLRGEGLPAVYAPQRADPVAPGVALSPLAAPIRSRPTRRTHQPALLRPVGSVHDRLLRQAHTMCQDVRALQDGARQLLLQSPQYSLFTSIFHLLLHLFQLLSTIE